MWPTHTITIQIIVLIIITILIITILIIISERDIIMFEVTIVFTTIISVIHVKTIRSLSDNSYNHGCYLYLNNNDYCHHYPRYAQQDITSKISRWSTHF